MQASCHATPPSLQPWPRGSTPTRPTRWSRDDVLAALVAEHGPVRLSAKVPVARRYESLAQSIAYQQLAGKAAASIWGRVRALSDDGFTPQAVLDLPPASLRGAGLSQAKADAVRDLARLVVAGDIRLDEVGRMPDDEVVAMLTQARGVGPWTARHVLDVRPAPSRRVAHRRLRRTRRLRPRLRPRRAADAEGARPRSGSGSVPTAAWRRGTAGASSTARAPTTAERGSGPQRARRRDRSLPTTRPWPPPRIRGSRDRARALRGSHPNSS